MKTHTLAKLLISLSNRQYEIAKAVHAEPSMLSRVANGVVRSRSDIMRRLAAYFSSQIGLAVDADLLSTPIDAKTLIATALHIRSTKLQKGIPA